MNDDALIEGNHRIANSLALVAGILRVEARRLGNRPVIRRDDVLAILGEVGTKIETLARLHGLLSRQPRLEAVNLADHLREVGTSLVSTLTSPERFDLALAFETGCWAPIDKAISLALIVTELVTNAIKYAHPTGVAGKIRIGGARDSNGILTIDVVDDGVGLPEGFDAATDGDIGFRSMYSLVKQLGASLDFKSSPLGLRARLRLPVELVAKCELCGEAVQPHEDARSAKPDTRRKRRSDTPHPLQASE